jgi:plastocyanin
MRTGTMPTKSRLHRGTILTVLSVLAVLVSAQTAFAADATVSVVDGAFQPATIRVKLTGSVEWGFAATNRAEHSSTENSGLGIWDSGLHGPGTAFEFVFSVSGTFPYHCILHAEMVGTVQVPPVASPPSGQQTTRFLIRWATVLPAGDAYNVQVKGPQDASFRPFRAGTTALAAPFLPDEGVGTYLFRSQLTNGTASSQFSPPRAIQVTG